ncbi:MAG TPA: hypothetical protein VF517_03815 [Thermoleophilaceae bacterium]|jgi:hypothetical protein
MSPGPSTDARRLEREREHERRARREAVRLNAAKGPGRNLEEAIRLARAADDFRTAFRPSR